MKANTRLATLLSLAAILGFMLAATSCTGLPPGTQAKLDQASTKYESTTGITPIQTASLLGKWWQDYQQAREIAELQRGPIIPATKASPVTSTKAVYQVQPQASAAPPSGWREPAEPPAPSEPEPGTIRRPDAHHALQLAALSP
jgi:hypothetical protein